MFCRGKKKNTESPKSHSSPDQRDAPPAPTQRQNRLRDAPCAPAPAPSITLMWHVRVSDIYNLYFHHWAPCSRTWKDTKILYQLNQRQKQAEQTELRFPQCLCGSDTSLSLSLSLSLFLSRAPAQIHTEPMTDVCVLAAAERRVAQRQMCPNSQRLIPRR